MVRTVKPQDPYRDDRLSLLAENEKLRKALRDLRSRRRRAVLLAVAVLLLGLGDVFFFGLVRSLVNAPDDARAYAGFGLAVVLIVSHLVVAIRVASRGE